jgi:hypothetical protein
LIRAVGPASRGTPCSLGGLDARHLGDADDLHDRLVRLVERMRS